MKGATAVSSATMLAPWRPNLLNLVLVRVKRWYLHTHCKKATHPCLPFLHIYIYSWSSQSHQSSTWFEGCCSRQTCDVHCWSHWNRTSELSVAALETSWGGRSEWRVAAVSCRVVWWCYTDHPQCTEVQWRALLLCHQQLCWWPGFRTSIP